MDPFATSHFSDKALRLDLRTRAAHHSRDSAILLTRIAEVDKRKLYVDEGYTSMHGYCVHELHFSDDAADRRVNAARAARKSPLLFVALADGRLHLTAILMLAPHLTPGNADELVAAATHKTRAEIAELLAQRFAPGPAGAPAGRAGAVCGHRGGRAQPGAGGPTRASAGGGNDPG